MLEMLVVIAVIFLLMAILLPSLSNARLSSQASVSASNLRQLGIAATEYLNRWDNHLPQMTWDVGGGNQQVIGALFGGKRGELPFYGIDQIGAATRPLNRYIRDGIWREVEDPKNPKKIEMPEFLSPLDIGQPDNGFGGTDSMYDYIGSSYTLNDHALDGEAFATLVPRTTGGPNGKPGGRMPRVADPVKTWMLAEHPIYNYQEGGNRGQKWYNGQVKAAICFVDGHTRAAVPIPDGVVNTTSDYTFLPDPEWLTP